jgi:PKD repeat protein
MKNKMTLRCLQVVCLAFVAFACSKSDSSGPSGVTASYQYQVDASDFLKVQFTNFSTHYVSLSWDFGDGSAASTDANPLHTYAAAGTYTVTLSATGSDKVVSTKSQQVVLVDPNTELKKLTGETTKSWKLLRDVSTGVYPLQVGPNDRSQIWWALGINEEVGNRPCILNDEWIFGINKSYQYNSHGDIWAEGGVWSSPPATGCVANDAGNFKNVDNADISGWNDFINPFDYDASGKTLTVNGGYIGLAKAGSTDEVKVPQTSVVYNVVKLADKDASAHQADTLILETSLSAAGGYWRFVLVHYDNPADEPAIPGAKPVVGFTYSINAKDVTFTNTTTGTGTITYAWDFGDGSSSTSTSPTHSYATDGIYSVKLTATNSVGNSSVTQQVTISSTTLTEAALNGGGSKIWVLKPATGSFEVGPNIADGSWYGGNLNMSDPASADYRPCLFNDQFIFKSGGGYEYNAQSDLFIEGYWGTGSTGCQPESAATGAAAIWKSNNTFTYTFTAASGNTPATITVNGLGAFIALPKAYNGGEYAAPPSVNNPVTYKVLSYVNDGTRETMQIYVDISAGQTGGGFWTFTLTTP